MNTWKIPSEVLHRLRNKQPDPKSELEKEVVGDRTSETIEKEKGICIELNYEHFDAFAVSTIKYILFFLKKKNNMINFDKGCPCSCDKQRRWILLRTSG